MSTSELPASSPKTTLSEETFSRLRSIITDQTGIRFRDNKRYLLESQLFRRLTELDLPSFEDYLHFIQNGHCENELPHLISAITINETSFFRHPVHYEVIKDELVPSLIEQNNRASPRVRFWSTACSTGDEPYSLAILVKEHLAPRYPNVRFEIVASDIDVGALATARRGTYGTYAVRHLPRYAQKYFTKTDDGYQLDAELRRMVTFRHLNLTDPQPLPFLRNFDIVLCANVLIYFHREAKRIALKHVYDNLTPNGTLLIGVTETLTEYTQAFHPVRVGDALVYQKRTAST